jgi:hypothetical protein
MSTEPRPTIVEEALAAASLIDAILIDPEHRLVRAVDLPTLPGHGGQIDPAALTALLGKQIELVELLDGEVLLVGSAGPAWYIGLDGPHHGPGLVLRYDKAADTYSDSHLTPERVANWLEIEDVDEDEGDNDGPRPAAQDSAPARQRGP